MKTSLNTTFFVEVNGEVVFSEITRGLVPHTLIEWFKAKKIKDSKLMSWTEGESDVKVLGVNGIMLPNQ